MLASMSYTMGQKLLYPAAKDFILEIGPYQPCDPERVNILTYQAL